MALTIFYSWQSDTPNTTNRNFIEDALKKAIARVKDNFEVQEAIRDDDFKFDKDTQEVPGTPPITEVIFDKISKAAIFIPDLTFVGKSAKGRLLPNPNVLIEYGYALKSVTTSRIIPVMNSAFGDPTEYNLPFNMRHLRKPLTYCLEENSGQEAKTTIREQLIRDLTKAIETVVKSGMLPLIKSSPDVDATSKERIVGFKEDRISRLFVNDTPIPFNTNPKTVLHLIPARSFKDGHGYNLAQFSSNQANLKPIGGAGWNSKYTFEGFLNYSNSSDPKKVSSYVHLYKNGIIEAVNGSIINPEYDGKKFRVQLFENELIKAIHNYLSIYKILKVDAPIFVFITIMSVADYSLDVGNRFFSESHVIDRDQLFLPELIIEKLDVVASDVLKPCFDNIWNAFGYSYSYNYDDAGKRINY